jgi:hypothetical protein
MGTCIDATVEVIERIERPARVVGGRTIAISAAILVFGFNATALMIVLSGGGVMLSPYEHAITPLVEQHNEIVGEWNGVPG